MARIQIALGTEMRCLEPMLVAMLSALMQRQEVPKQFHFRHLPAAIWHFRGVGKPWNTDDPLGASGAPLPDPLPADDDPQFDRTEPTDKEGYARVIDIRHAEYRRAAARLLGEALPETA